MAPFGGADRDRRDGRWAVAELLGQPHRNLEAACALDQRRDRLAADAGLHDGEDVVGVQAVAGRRLAIHLDHHLRLALVGLGRQVRHAGHAADHALELRGQLLELVQVLAIDLQRQRRAHAGDQFLHAHLDRLRGAEDGGLHLAFEELLHLPAERGIRLLRRPLVLGLHVQQDFHVVDVGRLALLGAADGGQHRVHLRVLLAQAGVHHVGHADRFVQRGRGDADDAEHDRVLLQRRHELLAEQREERERARRAVPARRR